MISTGGINPGQILATEGHIVGKLSIRSEDCCNQSLLLDLTAEVPFTLLLPHIPGALFLLLHVGAACDIDVAY